MHPVLASHKVVVARANRARPRVRAANARGSKRALFGSNDLDAETLSLHAGANVPVGALTLAPAAACVRTTRDSADGGTRGRF